MLTARLGLGGRCGLRMLLGLLRHHQRAPLGVGCQYAVVREAGFTYVAQQSYADTQLILFAWRVAPVLAQPAARAQGAS